MINERHWWKQLRLDFLASITFYTSIPIPVTETLDFQSVARLAPGVGLIIGGALGLIDVGMYCLGIPVLTRSALVVAAWVAITGGLHLDGAMDTADGLATQDPQRRLQVMADSATGAFGAMAAIVILLLKTAALSELDDHRSFVIVACCGWGRWGQQVAIAQYPYLKPTGKGAFHKAAIRSLRDVLPGLLLLTGWSGLLVLLDNAQVVLAMGMILGGGVIGFLTGAWFNYQLGGQTGDTYGAVVEWTEALLLCLLSGLQSGIKS